MKKYLLPLAAVLTFYACQPVQELTVAKSEQPMATEVIDDFIYQKLRQQGKFLWETASDEMIWSALKHSDQVLSVGFKPAKAEKDLSTIIHQINLQQQEWASAKQQLLALIEEEERRTNPAFKPEELLVFEEETLPTISVKVQNLSTIKKLRSSNLVRYTEPMGYEPKNDGSRAKVAAGSGCGGYNATNDLVAGTDYSTTSPNAKTSWHHTFHKVAQAWTKSTGAGVKILVIDTGASPTQDNLGSAFNQGSSSGRTIEKIVKLPKAWPWSPAETPNDDCGHGTTMAGVAAAPRGTDGQAAGIAYNAGLVTCRSAADVMIDESREVKGVSDALTLAGDRTDIKIVSMSLGRITSSSQISDAVKYAYNKGKLIFCAAGTSFGWSAGWWGVIFPAWMPEVQAVTGVKDLANDVACDDCHKGSEVDFVVVMERNTTGRHVLTLPTENTNTPATVGGSSASTSSMAGMAALVWSRFPSLTRDQIVNKLASSSSYYPTRNSNFGWGRVNADIATNGGI
jgi:subtilisin family serine protease